MNDTSKYEPDDNAYHNDRRVRVTAKRMSVNGWVYDIVGVGGRTFLLVPQHDLSDMDELEEETVRTLTREERVLIAAINKWRRSSIDYTKRWEQSFWSGWYVRGDRLVEVCFTPEGVHNARWEEMVVTTKESRYADEVRTTIPYRNVHQAVNLLVAMEILPDRFFHRHLYPR